MPFSYAMGRPSGVKKGSWNEEEDRLLKQYVEKYGEGNWKHIPTKSGNFLLFRFYLFSLL